jgi:hypothetical protein
MSYINAAPGVAASQIVVKLDVASALGANIAMTNANITLPALQDLTINAANKTFAWTQLDSTAEKQVATVSQNSLTAKVVVDQPTFFGSNLTAVKSDTTSAQGILGLSRNKTLVNFSIRFENEGTPTFVQGQGYVTGVAPAITADAPVWISPMNIAVTGEYQLTTSE